MRRTLFSLALLLLLIPASAPVRAWGFAAHKFIVERAIELLPPELKPFYEARRTFIVEHSVDPDLWRNAGFNDEPPRHFLDMDSFGPPPFGALPRDLDEAVQKFGWDMVEKNGLLPWRGVEMFDRLVRAFEAHKGGKAAYALEDVEFFSAIVAHYIGDAHQPFHAAANYDGQLTGQHGVHARFESELFERYVRRLEIRPSPPSPLKSGMLDFMFDALVTSFSSVDRVLDADRRAIGSGRVYDDQYFDRFFEAARPILERRLADAATAVASVYLTAWERGGKPALPVVKPRVVREVKP